MLAILLAACGARTELRGATNGDAGPNDLDPDFVWYRLDETSGTTAHDSGPHHWDLQVDGVSWSDGAVLDGKSTCGEASVDSRFREPPLTITAWATPVARTDETTTSYALAPFPPDVLSGDAPSLGGYGLGLDAWTDGGGGRALAVETGAGANVAYHSQPVTLEPGARHFVALVVASAAEARIYADGSPVGDVSADLPPSLSPAPLNLGCHNDDAGYGTKRFFAGTLRDVRVYLRALGADEIAKLYQIGPA